MRTYSSVQSEEPIVLLCNPLRKAPESVLVDQTALWWIGTAIQRPTVHQRAMTTRLLAGHPTQPIGCGWLTRFDSVGAIPEQSNPIRQS